MLDDNIVVVASMHNFGHLLRPFARHRSVVTMTDGLGRANRFGAWSMGLARVGAGAACLVAPEKTVAAWVSGETAAQPGVDVVARALGARELILGAAILCSLARGGNGRAWLAAAALADVTDAAAILAARHQLPRARAPLIVAVATGSAAVGAHLAWHLDP